MKTLSTIKGVALYNRVANDSIIEELGIQDVVRWIRLRCWRDHVDRMNLQRIEKWKYKIQKPDYEKMLQKLDVFILRITEKYRYIGLCKEERTYVIIILIITPRSYSISMCMLLLKTELITENKLLSRFLVIISRILLI